MLLYDDNESFLKLAQNPVFHQRSKHIWRKYHSLRDKVEEGFIELCKVDTGLNVADMMTENVGVGILRVCKKLAGMVIVDGCQWLLLGGGMWEIQQHNCILMKNKLVRPKLP